MIDTHVHLNSPKMIEHIPTYIENALLAGVEKMIVVGFDIESSLKAIALSEAYSCVYAAVGIHPCDCINLGDDDYDQINIMLDHPKVVALGEIGLDYYWDTVPKPTQQEAFKRMLKIAQEKDKPVIIHCRDAMEDTLNIIKESNNRGVFHCYSGSVETAETIIKMGYYISLGGPVTFKNAKVPKMVAAAVDIEKLLIETDAPYLAPEPFRGKGNEPAYVQYVASKIAELRNMSTTALVAQTTRNAERLFEFK